MMRRMMMVSAVVVLACGLAAAQAGTNNAGSQQETNMGTGRSVDNMTSPDINQQLTGDVGYTKGGSPDLSSMNEASTAGAGAAGAESTATVSTREQMDRQVEQDAAARGGAGRGERHELPKAFDQGGGDIAWPMAAQKTGAGQNRQSPPRR